MLPEAESDPPSFSRVPLPEATLPASTAAFSRDGRLLLLGTFDGLVQLLTLPAHDAEGGAPSVRALRPPPSDSSLDEDGLPAITQIAISADGQWLATADSARRVHAHSLDTLSYSSAIPTLPSPPTALAFMPGTSVLAVATARKHLVLYDVDRACLTSWSMQHAAPVQQVGSSAEVAHRIAFNPSRPNDAILCAQSWLCRVRVGSDTADAGAAAAAAADAEGGRRGKQKKKRGRAAEAEEAAGGSRAGGASPAGGGGDATQVVRSYGAMVLFDFTAADTAVVVEQPWLRVMDHFPPALYRHRFGT